MVNKQWTRHLALAFACSTLTGILSATEAGAYDIVTVNGKTYANVSGKLYPATYHETKLPNGRILNKWWAVDFSSYVPPKVDIPTPPPLRYGTSGPGAGTVGGSAGKPAGAAGPGGGSRSESSSDPRFSIRDVGTKHYITISADVLFEFDKWDLTEKAEAVLAELGPILAKYGTCTTIITGHTDSMGTDEYNQELSEKRAQTVKEWLVGHGFATGPVTTAGAGERSPVAPNTYNDGTDFPAGRAKNRRVEIVVDTAE